MTRSRKPVSNGQKKIGTLAEAFTAPVHDRQRQQAILHLVEHLMCGSVLLARCEDLVETQPHDHFGPMNAAARLLQANARVAEALARVAPAEQRRRSIVLNLQDDRPTREELIREIEEEKAQSGEDVLDRLRRRLDQLLEREQAAKKLFGKPIAVVHAKEIPATDSSDDAPAKGEASVDETGD
jgi:hypothetical protein